MVQQKAYVQKDMLTLLLALETFGSTGHTEALLLGVALGLWIALVLTTTTHLR